MKIDCGPQKELSHKKNKWHTWFSWHPVRVSYRDCRWLETVYRRGTHRFSTLSSWWTWEYQAIPIPKYLGGK